MIKKIVSEFGTVQVGAQTQYVFGVTYQGKDAEMRVNVRKEDVDVVEIRFGGPVDLAREIQAKLATLPLDVEP